MNLIKRQIDFFPISKFGRFHSSIVLFHSVFFASKQTLVPLHLWTGIDQQCNDLIFDSSTGYERYPGGHSSATK